MKERRGTSVSLKNDNEQTNMKKILILMAAALVVLAPTFAQTNNEDLKVARKEAAEARKMAKAAERSLKRDGYKPFELGSVSGNLEKYFLKVNAGCGTIVGTSAPCVSENLAKVTALANAANEYAIIQGGNVRGRIVNTASSLSGQQIDNIVASFERLVNKDIRGELVPYASFYKAKGSLYTARVYCIVDEDAAARARRHAMELALEEQALTEKYGSLVSDWIDEGFWKASEE